MRRGKVRMERTVRGVEVSWDGGGLNLVRCVDLRSLYEIDRGTVGKGAGWCVQTTQTLYERFKNERTKNEGETCRRARRRRWEGMRAGWGQTLHKRGLSFFRTLNPGNGLQIIHPEILFIFSTPIVLSCHPRGMSWPVSPPPPTRCITSYSDSAASGR